MILRSIKWRLQLWYGLILVLVLGGFGYTAFELQRTREFRRVDQELHDRMAVLFGPLRRPGRPPEGRGPFRTFERREPPPSSEAPEREGAPRGRPPWTEEDPARDAAFPDDGPFYYAIWDRNGRLVRSRAAPQGIAPPPVDSPGGIVQIATDRQLHQTTPRGERILVGRSIAAEIQETRNLAIVLFVAGGGILALGLAGGWFVATRAMRPIDKISGTAQKIALGDLSQRITHEESESELGRLVAVLNSTSARLENAFSEQARFTTDVSHELRTPVSVIVSHTQMALSRERSTAEYRDSLAACQRAAQRMRGLIESLLQLARLDAGQEQLRRDRFDLAQITRDATELLRPIAEERKLTLELDLAPVLTLGDPDKISQVVTNLVSNALQYTPHGTVRVACRSESGLALLTVADTGIGIPPADLPRIFDRFYRVDTSRSRDKGGSGLGLAITRAIIHAHGGTIDVASPPAQGTTFTIRLPAAPPSQ
jgi:two-component system OmpR family sensor kinase